MSILEPDLSWADWYRRQSCIALLSMDKKVTCRCICNGQLTWHAASFAITRT